MRYKLYTKKIINFFKKIFFKQSVNNRRKIKKQIKLTFDMFLNNSFDEKTLFNKLEAINNEYKINFIELKTFYISLINQLTEKNNHNQKSIAIPTNKINSENILFIYNLATSYGCFELAHVIRNYYKEQISKNDRKKYIGKLFENARYDEILKVIPNLEKPHSSLIKKIYNTFFVNTFDVNYNHEKDILFSDYIKDKRIAIVGPAKTENLDGQEIDEFDIVVRFNQRNKNGLSHDIKGIKCDISYFNLEHINSLIDSGLSDWHKETNWLIVNSDATERKLSLLFKAKSIPVKIRARNEGFNELSINTGYTALQKATIDLLQYNPKQIKVFHADFMITTNRYSGYKPKSWSDDMKANFLNICYYSHDPLTQFLLMQNYYNLGRISGDRKFEEVINLSAEEYMLRLEKIYK